MGEQFVRADDRFSGLGLSPFLGVAVGDGDHLGAQAGVVEQLCGVDTRPIQEDRTADARHAAGGGQPQRAVARGIAVRQEHAVRRFKGRHIHRCPRQLAGRDGDHGIMMGSLVDALFHHLKAGVAQKDVQDRRLVVVQMFEGEPARRQRLRLGGAGHLQHQMSLRRQGGMKAGEGGRRIVEMFQDMTGQD